MPKRREPIEDSQDPDAPSPLAAGEDPDERASAAAEGAQPLLPPPITEPPVRFRRKDVIAAKKSGKFPLDGASTAPVSPFGKSGINLPPSFLGARALFLLLRIAHTPQPVKLTFIGGETVADDALEETFRAPGWRFARKAPGIYDVDVPGDRIEEFLTQHSDMFRRVDAPGWLFGEAIPDGSDRAEITVSVDEPPNAERKRDLTRLGLRIVGEGEGELRGVILGKNLAGLLAAHWLGPVEVRKIHPPKG